jgi:superfamily II DNA/RNA helicase
VYTCIVATPGQLRDLKQETNPIFDLSVHLCLGRNDRMLDLGFDEEVGE